MTERLSTFLAALLVVAACAAAYLGVLGNDFVTFDDDLYVTANSVVLDGLSKAGVGWAFTAFHSANWHPLTWLSHMADVEVYGLNAGGHHATSLLLHGLNGVLLMLLFAPKMGRKPALFLALLFVLHPLRVESVAWVSERKDVLAGTFFFLTLHAWTAYAARRSMLRYLAALGLFALGLMSKPMLVTLPCVLFLFDIWPLARRPAERWTRLVLEKLPFLALSIASSAVTYLAQGRSVRDLDVLPFQARLLATPLAYGQYARATVWPSKLACLYPHGSFSAEGAGSSAAIVLAVVFIVLTLAALCFLRRAPWFSIGWLWFVGMLVPVIGLVQVGSQAWADRYAYLPTIGLYLIVIEAGRRAFRYPSLRRPIAAACVVVLGLCGYVTHGQVRHWRDGESLWRRATAVTEANFVAHNGLALILDRQGKHEEAEQHFREAIAVNPGYFEVRIHLARLLASSGREEAAIEEYRRMLWARPKYVPALANLGALFLRLGRLPQARRELEKAAAQNPRFPEARFNLGMLSVREGKAREAAAHFRAGCARRPPPMAVAQAFAWILATSRNASLRQGVEALHWARYALEATPGAPHALRVLAAAQAELGRFGEAVATQQRVVAATSNPKDTERLAAYRRGEPCRE